MQFGSMEYMEEVKRRSNADEEYQRLAQDESDSYLMIVKAEPNKGIPATLAIGYAADHGQRQPAATAQDGRRHHPLAASAADHPHRVRGGLCRPEFRRSGGLSDV